MLNMNACKKEMKRRQNPHWHANKNDVYGVRVYMFVFGFISPLFPLHCTALGFTCEKRSCD